MKIERLFNGEATEKFRLNGIASGDTVQFRNQCYVADPENFHFETIDEKEKLIDKQKIKKFLDDKKIDIPVDDFMVLWNFQVWLRMTYPDCGKNQRLRDAEFFKKFGGLVPLSEAFKQKIVMCTESSMLAQMYLQHRGITSILYSGNAISKPDQPIELGGDGHAWLMVTLNGKKYFYDPANPIINNNTLLPAIMDYSKISKKDKSDFEDIIHKSDEQGGGFAYLEAKDIYNIGRCWLYGFEYGFHRKRTEQAIKRQKPNIPFIVPATHDY
jgi:hypothetical protein